MPDQTTLTLAPALAPTPAPAKKRRPRGVINAKYLDEIQLVRELLLSARDPDYVALLTARDWPADAVNALETAGNGLETAAGLAVGRVASRKLSTDEEEQARETMLAAIHPIRAGAKRTFRGDNAAGRQQFFINEPLDVSLERLLFIAAAILEKLTPQPPATAPAFTLKGVLAGDIATLGTRRAEFVDAGAEQAAATLDSQEAHAEVERRFDAVRRSRIDLQLTADQAWPHADPANAPTRRAFQIPANRPAAD